MTWIGPQQAAELVAQPVHGAAAAAAIDDE